MIAYGTQFVIMYYRCKYACMFVFRGGSKASFNMLTAGAAAPAVQPPAPAVESKLWHCGGQTVSSCLLKKFVFTLPDE